MAADSLAAAPPSIYETSSSLLVTLSSAILLFPLLLTLILISTHRRVNETKEGRVGRQSLLVGSLASLGIAGVLGLVALRTEARAALGGAALLAIASCFRECFRHYYFGELRPLSRHASRSALESSMLVNTTFTAVDLYLGIIAFELQEESRDASKMARPLLIVGATLFLGSSSNFLRQVSSITTLSLNDQHRRYAARRASLSAAYTKSRGSHHSSYCPHRVRSSPRVLLSTRLPRAASRASRYSASSSQSRELPSKS